MKKQRSLFDGSAGESEEVFRRLQEAVRMRVTELLAELAIKQAKVLRKAVRDER